MKKLTATLCLTVALVMTLSACKTTNVSYRQFKNTGLTLAEARSYCSGEKSAAFNKAYDADFKATMDTAASRPRTSTYSEIHIGNQTFGTERERRAPTGGLGGGIAAGISAGIDGLIAGKRAMRTCMLNLGFVQQRTHRGRQKSRESINRHWEGETPRYNGEEDSAICGLALKPNWMDWGNNQLSIENIKEAKKRGLTVDRCRKILTKMYNRPPLGNVVEDSDKLEEIITFCRGTMNASWSGWDNTGVYDAEHSRLVSNRIKKAKAAGVTVGKCRKAAIEKKLFFE